MRSFFALILLVIFAQACKDSNFGTPKPRMFPKVDYPERNYTNYTATEKCPMNFSYPTYAEIVKKKNYYGENGDDDCWLNIEFLPLNGTLHCSYYEIENREMFDDLVNDAFELVGKHRIKTNYRDDHVIRKSPDVSGMLFQLDGAVASPFQFFLTDTTNHFFRGSLYFDAKVNVDSIAPIQKFVEEDLYKLIESFEWR